MLALEEFRSDVVTLEPVVWGVFDIVQPDVTKMGGISEQRRVAWMADEFGVR